MTKIIGGDVLLYQESGVFRCFLMMGIMVSDGTNFFWIKIVGCLHGCEANCCYLKKVSRHAKILSRYPPTTGFTPWFNLALTRKVALNDVLKAESIIVFESRSSLFPINAGGGLDVDLLLK